MHNDVPAAPHDTCCARRGAALGRLRVHNESYLVAAELERQAAESSSLLAAPIALQDIDELSPIRSSAAMRLRGVNPLAVTARRIRTLGQCSVSNPLVDPDAGSRARRMRRYRRWQLPHTQLDKEAPLSDSVLRLYARTISRGPTCPT